VVLAVGFVLVGLIVLEGALTLLALMVRTSDQGSQTITVPGRALTISAGSGDVHVIGGTDAAPHVAWTSHYSFIDPKVTVRQVGNELKVSTSCGSFTLLPVFCSTSIDVFVPAALDVSAASSAGDVTVSGISGAVTLESSAGDVRFDDITGAVDAHSSAGDVVGRGLRSTVVTARSDAGDVRLTFVVPPTQVKADSSAGDVRITLPGDERLYAVDAGTSAGDTNVGVKTSSESPYAVSAHSSAGDVAVQYPG
jgi:hypothetical protein